MPDQQIVPTTGAAGNVARVRLTNRFLLDLRKVYNEEGEACLRTLAAFAPDKFLALVARLVPTDNDDRGEGTADTVHRALEALAERRLGVAVESHQLSPDEEELLS